MLISDKAVMKYVLFNSFTNSFSGQSIARLHYFVLSPFEHFLQFYYKLVIIFKLIKMANLKTLFHNTVNVVVFAGGNFEKLLARHFMLG